MMLSCSDCGKTFTRRDNLLRHMKNSQHSINYTNNADSDEKLDNNSPNNRYFRDETSSIENENNKRLEEASRSIQIKLNALKRDRINDVHKLTNENFKNIANPHKRFRNSKKYQDVEANQETGDSVMNAFDKIDNKYSAKRNLQAEINNSENGEDNKRLANIPPIRFNGLKRPQKNGKVSKIADSHKRLKYPKEYKDIETNQEPSGSVINGSNDGLNATKSDDNISFHEEDDYYGDTCDDSKSNDSSDDLSSVDIEYGERYENHEPTKTRIYWSDPNKLKTKLRDMALTDVEMRNKDIDKLYNELVLEAIAESKNSIREKYRAHRMGKDARDIQLENIFKPITRPLEELALKTKLESIYEAKLEPKDIKESRDEVETPMNRKHFKIEQTSTPIKYQEEDSFISEDEFATPTRSRTVMERDETLKDSRHIVAEYFKLYSENSPKIDNTYGVYLDEKEWKIGNSNLVIDNNDIIIKGKRYKITMGLCELLFMKDPVKSLYTNEDLDNYRTILRESSAYKRNYDENEQIKGSKGNKYKEIISKLIPQQGMGLMQPNGNTDYIYWDDPNELVDRLRLLIASQQAGNNSHVTEILSIIEELRVNNIIE